MENEQGPKKLNEIGGSIERFDGKSGGKGHDGVQDFQRIHVYNKKVCKHTLHLFPGNLDPQDDGALHLQSKQTPAEQKNAQMACKED